MLYQEPLSFKMLLIGIHPVALDSLSKILMYLPLSLVVSTSHFFSICYLRHLLTREAKYQPFCFCVRSKAKEGVSITWHDY